MKTCRHDRRFPARRAHDRCQAPRAQLASPWVNAPFLSRPGRADKTPLRPSVASLNLAKLPNLSRAVLSPVIQFLLLIAPAHGAKCTSSHMKPRTMNVAPPIAITETVRHTFFTREISLVHQSE